jgi:hypothetical protein
MQQLTLILKLQAVAFALYGLAFLLAPDFTLDDIFGWEDTQTLFLRVLGASFLIFGWFDWAVADRLEGRLDLVWPLVAAPALILAVFVAQRVAGNYEGTEAFFWTSVAVTAFFTAAVGALRAVTPGRKQSS